jgi:uncharacterized protein (TIGR00725 family)
MHITVFGGSHPTPGSPDYENAVRLGRILGSAGHVVLTGGYMGTMEGVSRGASEVGAHVIGVTCEGIERWRPVKPNAWVAEERRLPTLALRIMTLIEGSQAALALPGGPGTLTEISLMWNLLLTQAITPRPLILIGESWNAVFNTIFDKLGNYIPEDQRQWLSFAPDVDAGATLLNSYIHR